MAIPARLELAASGIDSAASPLVWDRELAADLRLERSTSGLTVRFPLPVGLSASNGIGAECGNRTRLICFGRLQAQSHQTNSAQIEGFVFRFTAPRLHATDRSVRRTLGGGLRVV